MNAITVSELQVHGISAIETALASQPEVAIEVKGKQRFVVMDMDYYQQLRESELEIAWAQALADIAAGRYVMESAENHVKRLINEYHLPIDNT